MDASHIAAGGDLFSIESLIALVTLTALEIVLGIDNIVFIAIVTAKLPKAKQAFARRAGLGLAMIMRILLLLTLSWIMGLTKPLFNVSVIDHEFSGRDLIMLIGGLFLIGKSTFEIHERMEGASHADKAGPIKATLASALMWIVIFDVIFSLDSVITAVGMAKHLPIMIAAVVIAVAIMMIFAEVVSRFIEEHPTFKILALSFMLLIGVMLTAHGFGKEIEKGYIYFAMAFSLFVEFINIRIRKGLNKHEAQPEIPFPPQPPDSENTTLKSA